MTEQFSIEHAAAYFKTEALTTEVDIFQVFSEEIGEDLVDFMSYAHLPDLSHTSTIEDPDNIKQDLSVQIMGIALQVYRTLGKNISLEEFQNAQEIVGSKQARSIMELAITRFAIRKVVSEDLLEQHPELMTYISESVMGEV